MNKIKNLTVEQLKAILKEAKHHPARFIFGLSSTFFILLKIKTILKTKNRPPILHFSLNSSEHFEMIKDYRRNGILPKVFRAK